MVNVITIIMAGGAGERLKPLTMGQVRGGFYLELNLSPFLREKDHH